MMRLMEDPALEMSHYDMSKQRCMRQEVCVFRVSFVPHVIMTRRKFVRRAIDLSKMFGSRVKPG